MSVWGYFPVVMAKFEVLSNNVAQVNREKARRVGIVVVSGENWQKVMAKIFGGSEYIFDAECDSRC